MATEMIYDGRAQPARAGRRSAASRAAGWIVPLCLTAAAALLRLLTLSQQSFWLDEGYTVRLVHMTFGGMLRTIPHTESTPYLYYSLAWVWTRIFGFSAYGLRSLSAAAGIATVPVVYAAAARLAGRRAGTVAAALVAVSPLMVWFSQEARSYALAGLLSSLTLLCLIAFLQERRERWLWGWAAAAALGLLTHYFIVFVLIGELLWLWRETAAVDRRRTARAVALVAVVGAALIPLALAQQGTGHADYIASSSLGTTLKQIPKQMLIGYASPGQLVTGVLAALLVAGGALLPLARDRRALGRAGWPLAVGVMAVLAPVLLALAGTDYLNTRNLLPTLPPLAIGVGIGFAAWWSTRPRSRSLGLAAAGALALISVGVVVLVDTNVRYQRDDWRGVAVALGPSASARVIAVDPGSGLVPLQVYLPGLTTLTASAAVTELDVVVVPANSTGGGIGTPPRATAPQPVPAGFTLSATSYHSTYTVLRYTATSPIAVAPTVAGSGFLGETGYTALLQR